MEVGVAVFVLILGTYALVANALDRRSIGPAITFVAAGFVLGPDGLGVLDVALESETIRLLAEITLAFVLFTDASTVDLDGLRRDAGLIGRLLGLGLPLTILGGGLVAAVIFPELPFATALLISAILAPTDAALGMAVISNPAVPIRVRRVLNVESGLNDGIATPFVSCSSPWPRPRARPAAATWRRRSSRASSPWSWASSSAPSVASSSRRRTSGA